MALTLCLPFVQRRCFLLNRLSCVATVCMLCFFMNTNDKKLCFPTVWRRCNLLNGKYFILPSSEGCAIAEQPILSIGAVYRLCFFLKMQKQNLPEIFCACKTWKNFAVAAVWRSSTAYICWMACTISCHHL